MVPQDHSGPADLSAVGKHSGSGRLRGARPHVQVLALGLAVVVAMSAVAGVAVIGLEEIRNETRRENRVLLPASADLRLAAERFHAVNLRTLKVLIELPAEQRLSALSALIPSVNRANAAWRDYRAKSAGLPGEARLQAKFERAVQSATDLATMALSSSEARPPEFEALIDAMETQQETLDALEARYRDGMTRAAVGVESDTSQSRAALFLGILVSGILLLGGTVVTFVSTRARDRDAVLRARHRELETELQRALEMAHSEDEAYRVVERALHLAAPGAPAELLVADSSRAHFRQVVSTDASGGPGCPVGTPQDCPAAARGRAEVFRSSGDLAACPHLSDRPSGPCSAVCVPVAIAGKTVAVVHSTAPEGRVTSPETIDDLELVARKTGERLGMLRALSRSEQQARTDSLTGLLNRRSLEAQVGDLIDEGVPYVVAFGDLDHFKDLNDVHGHDAGDQALRLFARVLRDSVRPADIPARFGGEEFVVVLPECSLRDAYTVLERVRDRLEIAERNGLTPHFTVSFGLAPFQPHLSFGEVLARADAALLAAKAEGRDRVVVSGADGTESEITATVHRLEVSG